MSRPRPTLLEVLVELDRDCAAEGFRPGPATIAQRITHVLDAGGFTVHGVLVDYPPTPMAVPS